MVNLIVTLKVLMRIKRRCGKNKSNDKVKCKKCYYCEKLGDFIKDRYKRQWIKRKEN